MKKTERIIALDAFRGITIAAMIMVNQPGSWSYRYSQMKHCDWNGCTMTDLIFPFFLFIVGVAMWFSFQKYGQKLTKSLTLKILRRTVILFMIGLFLNLSFQFIETRGISLSTLRITGVFQRIALCFGIGAILCVTLKPKHLFILTMGILIGYWALLWGFGGSDPYSPESTIVGKIDIELLGKNHLRKGYPVDASGLFGTIPAVVNVIWGYLTGRMISLNNDRNKLILNMFLLGIPAVFLAWIWNYSFPINKTLWTSSFVLFSVGSALIVLAFLIWIIDIKRKSKWASPFIVFGVNPLFAYVFAELWSSIISNLIKIRVKGDMVTLKSWLYNDIFVPFAGNLNGSLLYSIFIMIFYWLILWVLNRKKIFIKI
ncbi:MAG: DUF5009 domain-containing protein [Bacteroidales bacterium]|nr:DUF5009 domain-containing protein [Bacteroidales bacterium]